MYNEEFNYDKEITKQILKLYENISKLRNSEFTLDLCGSYDKKKEKINNNLAIEEQKISINICEGINKKIYK